MKRVVVLLSIALIAEPTALLAQAATPQVVPTITDTPQQTTPPTPPLQMAEDPAVSAFCRSRCQQSLAQGLAPDSDPANAVDRLRGRVPRGWFWTSVSLAIGGGVSILPNQGCTQNPCSVTGTVVLLTSAAATAIAGQIAGARSAARRRQLTPERAALLCDETCTPDVVAAAIQRREEQAQEQLHPGIRGPIPVGYFWTGVGLIAGSALLYQSCGRTCGINPVIGTIAGAGAGTLVVGYAVGRHRATSIAPSRSGFVVQHRIEF